MRYHCPVYFVLSYHKAPTPISTRHIWLYDRGNYQSFARDLHETNWELLKDNDVDAYAKNIIDRITALAKQQIPNKTIKIRQSDPPWLTCEIKKIIRKRKRLYKKYKKTKRPADFEKYKHTRNITTAEIRKAKQFVIDKLAAKLRNTDTGPRDWWKTLKHLLNQIIPHQFLHFVKMTLSTLKKPIRRL